MMNLESLPTEVLVQISTYLSPSARLSLKLTSKVLFLTLPGLPSGYFKACSKCEENVFKRSTGERELLGRGQRRCVLCGGVQSADFFVGDEIPVCKWHEAWFLYQCGVSHAKGSGQVKSDDAARAASGLRYTAVERMYCVHERNVVERRVAECSCGCNSCGHFEVDPFIPLPPRDDDHRLRASRSPGKPTLRSEVTLPAE